MPMKRPVAAAEGNKEAEPRGDGRLGEGTSVKERNEGLSVAR
jgi:hypothetical protein